MTVPEFRWCEEESRRGLIQQESRINYRGIEYSIVQGLGRNKSASHYFDMLTMLPQIGTTESPSVAPAA
jgi:hypothetical protein